MLLMLQPVDGGADSAYETLLEPPLVEGTDDDEHADSSRVDATDAASSVPFEDEDPEGEWFLRERMLAYGFPTAALAAALAVSDKVPAKLASKLDIAAAASSS